jgi:nuclear pore complex protein Nup205
MDSPSHLRAILRKILDNGTLHGEPELFEELTLNRDTLLRLFDVGGKNANERRELESGTCFCIVLAV